MTSASFNQCVDDFADGLFRFSVSMLGDNASAEDAVQDVFERFWLKRHNVTPRKEKKLPVHLGTQPVH